METRTCSKCGTEKPITDYVITDKRYGYRRASCKPCDAARVRAHYAANPEYRAKTKARAIAFDKANPIQRRDRGRRWKLRRVFGITLEQYEKMLLAQGGCCALCGASHHGRTGESGRHNGSRNWSEEAWNVDHDHKTGRVRGLLCLKCNVRVGAYEGLRDEVGFDKLHAYLGE